MKEDGGKKRLPQLGAGVYLFFLLAFALAALYFRMYFLAAAEAGVIIILLIYSLIARRIHQKQLTAYIESIAYDTENAKNSTLMHFPLPIAVFRLSDSEIVWGNEMFFEMYGKKGSRVGAAITDLVPQFSGRWLMEGRGQYPELLALNGRKYQLHGNLVRSEKEDTADADAVMGITYWVDVTEYDDMRIQYEESRPVPGVVVLDNLDELARNQTERAKNELRDSIEDKLSQWAGSYRGILRRYDRDRYLVIFEKKDLDKMKQDRFRIVEDLHQVESPNGVVASISIGLGTDAATFEEGLQFADMATELALSRGGDQTVVKNRLGFEFYGGRGTEVEKRTKVRSRVMANTLSELVRDSSRVLVMGHRFADLDALGAAVGVVALARKCGRRANVVIDREHNAVGPLINRLSREPEYDGILVTREEGETLADGRTLLVIVDTNRPDRVEDPELLALCSRVAVIDHHRVSATYIQNAALGFIEPYASSASELVTEVLLEVGEAGDLLRCEAEGLLAGIVLDTKSFSIRTGERTFDAAAFLRRAGADTVEVKKLFQMDMENTVARYKIMQSAELYRKVAVAAPEEPQDRIVTAQAADELLNIQGVDASVVAAPDGKGGVFASARSIGELNVQILMEKLGGGGNRSAAAVQLHEISPEEARQKIFAAIDEYYDA